MQLDSLSDQISWDGKTNEAGQQFYRACGPDGCKEGNRETVFRGGHDGNGSRMGMEVLTLKGTMAFNSARAKSVQSLPRREAPHLHGIPLSALLFSCPSLLQSQAPPSEVLSRSEENCAIV